MLVVCFSGYPQDTFLFVVADVETIFLLTGYNVSGIADLCFYFLLKKKRISIIKNANSEYISKLGTCPKEYIYFTTQFSHSPCFFIFWHRDSLSEVDCNRTHD